MSEIDPFPLSALPDRFGVSRQTVNVWISQLGITTQKQGKRAYISLADLDDLDRLSEHLANGGKMADFPGIISDPTPQKLAPTAPKIPPQILEMMAMMKALQPPRDPLAHWEQLEKAAANGWLLSSSEIEQLLGTRPHGDRWERGAFVFVRSGKIGRETSYRIEKL